MKAKKITQIKRLWAVLIQLCMLVAAVPVSADGAALNVSVRNGKAFDSVQLLDTLVASVNGGTASTYKWKISDDEGTNRTDIEGATSNELILTAAYAGKTIECAATVNGTEIYSQSVQIPNYNAISTANNGNAPDGTADTTPATDKFTVDGKEFVLLDSFDNDESTYYVTTTEAYGDMQLLNSKTAIPSGKQINYDAYKSNTFSPELVSFH